MILRKWRAVGLAAGLGVLVALVAAYSWERKMPIPRLRVAMPSTSAIDGYDPANIRLDYEYILLEALFSSLTEHDSSDQLVAGVAGRFRWLNDTTAVLDIRPGLRTIDGAAITAEDALFSLKRILLTGQNTHGDLAPLLCGERPVDIESPCEALRVEGNSLVITLKQPNRFLFEILSSIDFAIIPHGSCDRQSLRIVDFRNTSGPYYLERVLGKGHFLLRANPSHFRYHPGMPQEIEVIPNEAGNGYRTPTELYSDDIVDHVPTVGSTTAENLAAYHATKTLNIHRTLNLKTSFLTYTQKGRMRPASERLRIAASIQRAFRSAVVRGDELSQAVRSLFPPESDFAPTRGEMERINGTLVAAEADHHDGRGITIVGTTGRIRMLESILKPSMPHINLVEAPIGQFVARSGVGSWEDNADLKSFVTDVSIAEEINGISYGVKRGRYSLKEDQIDPWLRRYLETPEKADRVKLMRELHVASIVDDPVLIPLQSMPYVATVRKPWVFDLSRSIANNQFHRLRYQP